MEKFTVDTTNKLFVAKEDVTSVDVQIDLYSDAKEYWLSDSVAMGFKFPLIAIGGDPLDQSRVLGTTYFLTDGWRIRPDEANHTLDVTGNLYVEGGLDDPFVPTAGSFQVLIRQNTSNIIERLEAIPAINANTNLIPALL